MSFCSRYLHESQLEFSLLALRDDPLPTLQSQLNHHQALGNVAKATETIAIINNEKNKRERWAVSNSSPVVRTGDLMCKIQFENSLRRHNFVGLAYALLMALGKENLLSKAQDDAQKIMNERIEKRKAKSTGMDDE